MKGTPAVPAAQLTVTTIGWPATLTVADPVPVTAFPSLAVLLMLLLPFGEQVTEIVFVVEEPVHPVGRVQVNVYGAVPPLAAAVHVKALPEVTPLPQLTVTLTGWPATTTFAVPEAVTPLALVAVARIV